MESGIVATTRRTRRIDAIPPPSSGLFRRRSAGSKTAIRNPLTHIEISPAKFDASQKVRRMVRSRRAVLAANKKGLTNLALVGHRKLTGLN